MLTKIKEARGKVFVFVLVSKQFLYRNAFDPLILKLNQFQIIGLEQYFFRSQLKIIKTLLKIIQ